MNIREILFVVDDNPDDLFVAEQVLTNSGFAVKVFEYAKKCLKYVEEGHIPKIIVLDYRLNGDNMSAIDFIQKNPTGQFQLNNTFYHYGGGTNWANQSEKFHKKKTALLNTFINSVLRTK